jgi:multidrug transporter EmrE-like cation transporter
MNSIVFCLLLLGVMLNAGAQLLLKVGMTRIGHFDFSWSNALPIGMQVAVNPYVLVGLVFYVVSVVVWLLVLSRIDVSVAYPMLSLGYVVNALIAYYWLGEDLSMLRISGILIILLGVFLVARN